MVFLFIAYFATIILFVFPIDVGFYCFSNNLSNKLQVCIRLFAFRKYLKKNQKNENTSKKNLKKKNRPFLKFSFKGINELKSLKMIIVDKLFIAVKAPKTANSALYYPVAGIFKAFSEFFNTNSTRFLVEKCEGKAFFQISLDIKINLFMIFSIFFQIIKPRLGRKNGNN